ncbi:hypothetical protein HPC49_06855 [Pyxidicoccus fallax]|uniref:NurA domain-containing protein n=1 Tax=Pyxidicoccus fallax TaxID=394095 RepID=A0A848LI80_9BACT|nr:hypothetical protein [Pyxidicoccus fallax]NMO17424.1 hypothetical protein [Pyxidicoccus fallax]NPC77973.1 hypothetical protein [Pyxidicoccus fallax]
MSGGIPPEVEAELFGDDEYRAAFGEDLSFTLDLDKWSTGLDLDVVMDRFRKEIANAVKKEGRLRAIVRSEIFPRLPGRQQAFPEAGIYEVTPEEVSLIHERLLFRGKVDAVTGSSASHDSLPIGISQIGVAVVGYGGTSGAFSQRLFRKEMSSRSTDPMQEAMDYINMRQNRFRGRKDTMSRLARRGIRTYAERAALLSKSSAEWRMGLGNPCAHELLSGSGYMSLLELSLRVLRRLIHEHKKFVFVSDALQDRGFLTMGFALDAGEYVILETLQSDGEELVEGWQYGDRSKRLAWDFVRQSCPHVVKGLFRVSDHSPPRLFYAHREHFHEAACIAMADSILRPERAFPMLLDVAEMSCRSAFGDDGFLGLVHDAYAQADANLQYFSERGMRR